MVLRTIGGFFKAVLQMLLRMVANGSRMIWVVLRIMHKFFDDVT